MSPTEMSIHTLLHDAEAQSRYHAIDRLQHEMERPEVVEALIVALGDEGYYEIPEPGAPSHIYAVCERAVEALTPVASQHLARVVEEMHKSAPAMISGLSLMPFCCPSGERVVLDALNHLDANVPPKAASVLVSMLDSGQTQANPALLEALFQAQVHPNVFVRSTAISGVKWYFVKRPEIDPAGALPPSLLEILAQAVRDGKVRSDAGWPFLSDQRMLEACVHRAARGDEQTCYILRNHLARLDDALVAQLATGVVTAGLAELLGDLGERARGAVATLLATRAKPGLEGPGAVALLRIPGSAARSGDNLMAHSHQEIADLFMRDEGIREAVARHHPDPTGLAAAVIPRLLEQWQTISLACRQRGQQAYTSDLAPLRGMRALGPLMVGQMPWLLTLLEPYGVDKIPRHYAMEMVSTFGEGAREAFPKLARLLDQTDDRGPVLRALVRLGPIAGPDFQTLLEVLELESRSWTGWQWNWWRRDIVSALAAVQGEVQTS